MRWAGVGSRASEKWERDRGASGECGRSRGGAGRSGDTEHEKYAARTLARLHPGPRTHRATVAAADRGALVLVEAVLDA